MAQEDKKPVSTILVGIAGMGQSYLETLLAGFSPGEVELLAVVDPFPELSPYRTEFHDRNIPVLPNLVAAYENRQVPDLVVVCSPIHHHVSQTTFALEKGSCVLCEKPIGATIQDAERLVKASESSDPWAMIGYQWSYSRAIRSLKKDILSGEYGKPVRMKTLCCWPRDEAYYNRNDWAGKIRDAKGNWVLDSPANNAMAHFLHNLFYILGDKTDRCAMPSEVTAELYRTYPIDNYDSVACRAFAREGAEILFFASHATSDDLGPIFELEFETARITYGENSVGIVAQGQEGSTKSYGSPEAEHPLRKLFEAVETVREPKAILCGPQASIAQTLCMNGMQESVAEITDFPPSRIVKDPDRGRWWVQGLRQDLQDCYKQGILPSEARLDWARSGKPVSLTDYHHFPRRE
jgi:predicted dehydrogenase